MMDPSSLMKKMNQLCMQMTHTRRQKDSKKNRKFILRKMKKLSQLPIEAREKISSIATRGMAKNRMDRGANAMCDRSY